VAKQKMSKRQRTALAKRQAILSSPAFKEWWRWRRHIHPLPSDPYRAFMIDLGLFAQVHRKDVWKFRTNWTDYPPVDLPRGAPRRRKRLPPRKEERRRYRGVPKAAKPIPMTPIEKELTKYVREMEEAYHLPATKIIFEKRPKKMPEASYIPALFGKPMILMHRVRPEGKAQSISTILHEAGHHAHRAYYGHARVRGIPELSTIITASPRERVKGEKIAWGIARAF